MTRNKIVYYIVSALVIVGIYFAWRSQSDDKNNFYGFYNDVNGLQESSPIYLKGVKIGKVDEVMLQQDGKVKVVLGIDNNVPIQQGSVARIAADGISGGSAVYIKPGNGQALLPASTLATSVDSALADKFHSKISPMIRTGKVIIRTTDSALNAFNQIVIGGWGTRTQQEVARFSTVLDNIAHGTTKANQATQNLPSMMQNAAEATGNPGDKNREINNMIVKGEQKTSDIRKKDIGQSLNKLATSLNKFSATISKTGNNKMFTDKAAYENASKSLDTLNRSLKSTLEHPQGFTLFPKKK